MAIEVIVHYRNCSISFITMIIIIPVLINTGFDKTCHLSNDEIMVCKLHVVYYGKQLLINT